MIAQPSGDWNDPPSGRHPDAVSNVVGAVVLIGVAVLAMGIVIAVLISGSLPTQVPSFSGIIWNTSKTVYITHEGGDPLIVGQFRILVNGSYDETASFTKSLSTNKFSVGMIMNATFTAMPQRVVVVYNSSWGGGTVLASADLYPRVSPAPPGWYSGDWHYRKKITIDHTKVIGSDQPDFPVLVKIDEPELNDPDFVRLDGYDMFFTASDGTTPRPYEVEYFDRNGGHLIAWVKVPLLSSSANTTIYLYYGNPGAPNQQDPASVWDSHYVAVWHLGESGTGAPGEFKDSTHNGINGQGGPAGGCPTLIQNGAVGGAQSFDGSNDNISMGTSTLLQPAELTFSYWISRGETWNGLQRRFFWAKGALETTNGWYVDVTGAASRPICLATNQAGWLGPVVAPDTYYPLNVWTYMVVTFSTTADVSTMYKNAVAQTVTSWGTLPTTITSTTDTKFVAMGRDPAVNYVKGSFDELRISDIVRSPGWITTEYNNQNSPATFLSVGGRQTVDTMS